jgi:hypothetical protein
MSRSRTRRHLTGSRTQDSEHSDMAVLRAILVTSDDEGVKRGGKDWTVSRLLRRRSPNGRILGPTVARHNCDTYRLPLHGVGDAPGDVGKNVLGDAPNADPGKRIEPACSSCTLYF